MELQIVTVKQVDEKIKVKPWPKSLARRNMIILAREMDSQISGGIDSHQKGGECNNDMGLLIF